MSHSKGCWHLVINGDHFITSQLIYLINPQSNGTINWNSITNKNSWDINWSFCYTTLLIAVSLIHLNSYKDNYQILIIKFMSQIEQWYKIIHYYIPAGGEVCFSKNNMYKWFINVQLYTNTHKHTKLFTIHSSGHINSIWWKNCRSKQWSQSQKRQFNHILHNKHIMMYYLQCYKSFSSDCTFPIAFKQGNCSNLSQITVETGNPLFLPNYPFQNSLLCTLHTFLSPPSIKISTELSSVVIINPTFIHTSPFS